MNQVSIPALIEAFSRFKFHKIQHEKNLCHLLDEFSAKLAKDEGFRRKLPNSSPSIWEHILDTWKAAQPESTELSYSYGIILSLSRFTRNLVAGVPDNQSQAFVNAPEIRRILHHLTSFSQFEDNDLYPLTRMLVQTLSNIVTLNGVLATRLWDLYTTLSEDQNILTRLLASPDTRTVSATMVMILNCVHAEERILSQLTAPNGLRIVIRVLNRTEEWVSQEPEELENGEDEAFTIAYRLFETLLDQDLAATLYPALSLDDEPITPHQTTFLKLIDSYLRNQNDSQALTSRFCDYSFLHESFGVLCSYSQRAIQKSLGQGSSPTVAQTDRDLTRPAEETGGLKELDLRLPKVCAAIILISQCLTTICLETHGTGPEAKAARYSQVLSATQAPGFVENIIDTLRLVDRFLPRIVFGKAVAAPGETKLASGSSIDLTGFSYLKRDLVRLLGTICYGRRVIQDRIRECGGIQVVMNLCVIDERNPYLQEHAVFALHNILDRNPDNQAIVNAMRPVAGQT